VVPSGGESTFQLQIAIDFESGSISIDGCDKSNNTTREALGRRLVLRTFSPSPVLDLHKGDV
jgi:hypothetical protein